ncbi:MAG: glycosyltransferase family 2 protein [Cellulomonas sp.]|nr:glycosyltransferase family 2 protein [Cellulomonas sp.]MBF0687211.1 glycosyltransferase family 2 protein [Cellulomonas sp.]
MLVVLPAWNESESLPGVLAEIREHLPGVGVLVVDDGSLDGTAAVARAHGVDVLELPFNLGVGGAMRAGFRYALESGYDAVVQVDADGQHDPRDVPRIVERLAHADVVIGARFAGTGQYVARGPRRWAMRVLAAVLSRVASTRLTDTTSGFRAAGPRAVALFARHYPAEYLGDTVESLVIAARCGLQIEQIGVAMRERSAGRPSQSPVKASIYLARACLALLMSLMRRRETVVPQEVAV